jgi:hypothetical protein
MIYAGLGDKDQAFEWLNKAFEARSEHLTWLKVDASVQRQWFFPFSDN